MSKTPRSPQREREYALYRYRNALEHGDFDTLSIILKQAERDPALNEMIEEMDAILESASERETGYVDWRSVSPAPFPNGQPTKPKTTQENPEMTTQPIYWEPNHRMARITVAMLVLVAALVIGIVFLFLTPSRNSLQTLLIQQPTPTVAEIAQLYVDEMWGKGNQDVANSLMAADFVDHDPMFVNNGRKIGTEDKNNSAVFVNNVIVLHTGFPDLSVKTDAVIEGGDRVVVRWTFTGTHTQPFLTYSRTDKSVTITNTDILRIVNGQIVERWGENKLQAIKDAIEIVDVSPSAVQAVTAFARFAYLYSTNNTDAFGDALNDDIVLNGQVKGLEAVKKDAINTARASNGLTDIKMISAMVSGDHLIGTIEFYTNNGRTLARGTVRMTIKDGKIISYDFTGSG